MGLYDREYYREEDNTRLFGENRPLVFTLIIINFIVFAIDYFSKGQLTDWCALRADLFTHPWFAYQLVTAGFLHSTSNIWHILINMYSLWLFGREVETTYGRNEFLRLYLGLIILSSLVWVVGENLRDGLNSAAFLVGASGGVTGIMVIFACHFPQRTLLLWGLLPLKVWVLVVGFIVLDIVGASQRGTQTAFTAHLGGAFFGFLYYRAHINLGKLTANETFSGWFKKRPKLKLRRPEEDDDLNTRVDKILEKISREGEASLSRAERRLLESASRRYQQRRR